MGDKPMGGKKWKQILLLDEQKILSKELVKEIENINHFRNNLVHNPSPPIMNEVEEYSKKLKRILKKVREL